jgi:catechol 2,3-dioxygenase-like lactoylglutathione lyase family enzyme
VRLKNHVLAAIALLACATPAGAQTGFANMVDHVHLAVPNQVQAVAWYAKHFGGKAMAEGTDRLMFGETRLNFQRAESAKPTDGSVLDHIAFSVPDVDAALQQLGADGAKIVTPARDEPGLFRHAFVQDPWGVRIEILHDADKLGLHHVHLSAPDPAAVLAWYVDALGGSITKLKGTLDGINYGGVWLLVQQGSATPSAGHALDHMGMRPFNVDQAIERLRAKGVKVTTEPKAAKVPNGDSVRLAFIEGPQGIGIEVMQR